MSKRKKITIIIPLLISSLILVLSIWCSKQERPITPEPDVGLTFNKVVSTEESRTEPPSITTEAKTEITSSELKFVELPTTKGTQTYVFGKVTVKAGGHLHLGYHQPANRPHRVHIKIDLKTRPHSVSADGIWSLRLNPKYLMVDLNLKPKSIEFINPATLCIDAQNLDLSEMNPHNIGVYYYDEDKDNWEFVEPIHFNVVINKGHITGCWYIEHFSRYAIASR